MAIKMYGKENIKNCPWPDNADGRYAKELLTPLILNGVSSYIQNVNTQLFVLICGSVAIPITVNEAEYNNAHVCSPYGYFISYASESLDVIPSPLIKKLVEGLLSGLGTIFRWGNFNKVVHVNNWFFSVNLYPELTQEQITSMLHFLKDQFPQYAIVFRSIDSLSTPVCFETLHHLDFSYIASKQVFLLHSKESTFFDSRLFKSDLKLIESSGYQVLKGDFLSKDHIPRLLELYYSLYIEKYSHLNPKITQSFLELMIEKKLFTFLGLTKGDQIDGIVGYLVRDGKMYCPFFGYDNSLPKDPSLYRILSTLLFCEARDGGYLFHQSSGASTYKKMRKAKGCIDYTAVFHKHLSLRQRIPWWMAQKVYNNLGIKYMVEY